jgi:membrane-associated phospholipid phosphatase
MHLLTTYLLTLAQWLGGLDRELFKIIAGAHESWLDGPLTLARHQYTWIPLYAFVLFYIVRFQRKYAWQFVVCTLVCFAITDYTSASILKPLFGRLRPCHEPELQMYMRDLVGCGGRYSMPSSHASNHFGLASFWYLSISWMSKRKWWWLWLWALLVCYAQVYVGKHYPGDILVGAVFGSCVGVLLYVLMKKYFENRPVR